MRIVIDARYLRSDYTGIGTFSARMLEALSALDSPHEYHVIVHDSFSGRLKLGENFTLHEHPAPPVSLASVLSIGSIAKSLRADILHTTFPLTPLNWRGPLVTTVHDLQPMLDPNFHGERSLLIRWAYGVFYRWAYATSLRRSLYVLCDSHYTRLAIQQWMPRVRGKCLRILLGVAPEATVPPSPEDVERVREEKDLPPRYLLYLGSTRPNKNLPRMLDAFIKYKAAFPEDTVKWVLVVRPDRFFDPVLNRLRREGLLGEVIILESVSEADKRVLLANAEALMFATMYEGFGLPVLEAQALGTPVLISTDGALPEVAGKAAVAVDPLDSSAIMAGLVTLLRDEKRREELRQQGPDNAARFTWEAHARETLAVYDHLVGPLLRTGSTSPQGRPPS